MFIPGLVNLCEELFLDRRILGHKVEDETMEQISF
jgi:hypothetical protein